MPGNIGITGLIIILVIVLIIFGPSKLPQLGRAFGRTLTEFKKSNRTHPSEDDKQGTDDDKRNMEKR